MADANSNRAKARRYPRSPNVTVQVTRDLIEVSVRRDSSHCMIAEAIKLAVPTAEGIAVDLQSIRWSDPKLSLRYIYLTPRPAQLALIDFDLGNIPEPFAIKLVGAHVTAAKHERHRRRRARIATVWEPLKETIRTACASRSLSVIAAEIGTPVGTLSVYSRDNGKVPGDKFLAKARTWAARQEPAPPSQPPTAKPPETHSHLVGDPPPTRVTRPTLSQADLVRGKARFRGNPKVYKDAPEIVGGRPPPIGNLARKRAFGLRLMVR